MEFAVTTFLALMAIVVAVVTFRAQNRGEFKRLHYVSHFYPLILAWRNDDDEDGLPVTISARMKATGRRFVYPQVVTIQIENTGRAPITASDYAGPLKVEFGQHAYFMCGQVQVNRADVVSHEPDSITWNKGDLHFAPTLLNPGDRVTLVSVVDGFPEDVRVTARIAGIEEVATLPSPIEGYQTKVFGRSLLFEKRVDWPTPKYASALSAKIPVLFDPEKAITDQVEAIINGVVVPDAHYFGLILEPVKGRSEELPSGSTPFKFKFPSSQVAHVEVRANEKKVSRGNARKYVRASANAVEIKSSIQELLDKKTCVDIFLQGEPDRVEVLSKPEWVDDIQIMEMIAEDYLRIHLASLRPRVLLSNRRLYRTWHRLCDFVEPKFNKLIGQLRKRLLAAHAKLDGFRRDR